MVFGWRFMNRVLSVLNAKKRWERNSFGAMIISLNVKIVREKKRLRIWHFRRAFNVASAINRLMKYRFLNQKEKRCARNVVHAIYVRNQLLDFSQLQKVCVDDLWWFHVFMMILGCLGLLACVTCSNGRPKCSGCRKVILGDALTGKKKLIQLAVCFFLDLNWNVC